MDECAGVSHGDAVRCGGAGQQGEHRLGEPFTHQRLGEVLFFGAADLANHQQARGLGVRFEQRHEFGKPRPLDGVAASTDPQGLADAAPGEAIADLVGQRPALRHHAHCSGQQRRVGQKADLHLAGHCQARSRGADHDRAALARHPDQ